MLAFGQLFRFYINASIHVAFAVVSLYLISIKSLNVFVNWNLLGFLFFSTIVCYNFVKYGVEAEKYLIVAKPSHKPIQIFSFLAFGLSLFFLIHLQLKLWAYIGFFTILSGLYAVPFLPSSKNLRSFAGLKIFLIALIWTGFTLGLPVIDNDLRVTDAIVLQSIQRFLLVLVLILPFEIRDLKYDRLELRTVHQRFGVLGTKQIGFLLVLTYLILGILKRPYDKLDIVFLVLTTLLLAIVLYRTKERQTIYFASFWVEGVPIFLCFLFYGLM